MLGVKDVRISDFKRELGKRRGIQIGDYYLFRNLELYEPMSGESIYFKNFREALRYEIYGVSLKRYIWKMNFRDLDVECNR